ncbi:unnamed protein product [Linum tenue]|uniref:Cytochrome P450 n=1 Tax=Linum tenue TaxID=586396 RepID=A0AAV0N8M7_9ROSI|nr:unnamed protein product [Linum tenue]
MAIIPLLAILLLTLLSFVLPWRRSIISSIRNTNLSLIEWPVLGVLPGLLWNVWTDNIHGAADRTLKDYGGTFLFKGPWFANMDFIGTSDPLNAHHIFSKSYAKYRKGEDFKAIFEFLGEGIFNADGEAWKFQRQLLHSILNNEELQNHMTTTLKLKMECTLFPVLDARVGAEVDMQEVAKMFMFDNFCLWVLGFGYLCVDRHLDTFSCGKAYDDIEEAVVYRHIVPKGVWKIQRIFGIGSEKKFSTSIKVLDKFLYDVVKTKKQELHKEDKRLQHELLTQWMVADEREESSDKFLRDFGVTLIAAGKDSVSSVLTWLLWLVVIHPRVEKKIIEEIERVVSARGTSRFLICKDDLHELVYLHAAIYETLRLYPPLPFEHRCATEADVLPSGHKVHKGMRMLFSMYSMGRMEETWGKDCMDFKPERWISDEGNIIHVPSQKFMTFLTGPRTCLGKAMSFMLLKFMVSSILWNYKFEMVEGHVVKPTPSMVLSMKDGLKMRVSKRKV